jgi:type VI secretion system protein ImpL
VSLDPGVKQVSVTIAGRTLTYNHGPTEPMQFQWPGADGSTSVNVAMTPIDGAESDTGFQDSWALLHLLDNARVIPSGQPDQFRIEFSSAAGTATFELNANSVRNPFTLGALRSFRCPGRL